MCDCLWGGQYLQMRCDVLGATLLSFPCPAKWSGCEDTVGTARALQRRLYLGTYGHISTRMQQDAAQKVGGFLRNSV